MATANDIINRALRSLSVIGQGEPADADQAADALVSLNDMVAAWANESLMLYQVSQDIITLVPGKADYTIGEGAYDKNAVRPVAIESAFVRSSGTDCPVAIVDNKQYQSIVQKANQGSLPDWLCLDVGFPASTLRLWPVPSSAATLYINSQKPLTGFSTLSAVVSLPPGYERALRLNLAVELMPEYQVRNDKIDLMAREAKAGIKRVNQKPIYADLGIPSRRFGNFEAGC